MLLLCHTRREVRGLLYTKSVLSAGIEPTLQAPQACVLSVERRERDATVSHYESAATRFASTAFLRDAVFFLISPRLAALSIA